MAVTDHEYASQERLKAFYALWSPDRSSRIDIIVRTFEERGGDGQALYELNEELREVCATSSCLYLARCSAVDGSNQTTIKDTET